MRHHRDSYQDSPGNGSQLRNLPQVISDSENGEDVEGHWRLWCKFLAEELGEMCPLLLEWPESQKSMAVALFLHSRHQEGSREKQATAVTAGVRLHFTAALLSTAFLESSMVSAARV